MECCWWTRAQIQAAYDQEQFIVLHDWEPYYSASDDGSLMVEYVCGSINGRMLGHDAPIEVREGQRVLFHILNASATEPHWLALPGHRFKVLALDGSPVATQASVETLRLGPAERITAMVTMDTPGVWVLGEARDEFRNAGMGTVIEYAGRTGKPVSPQAGKLKWDYRAFAEADPAVHTPDVTIPLVFSSRFKGHGALDKWMINGKSWPDTDSDRAARRSAPPAGLREQAAPTTIRFICTGTTSSWFRSAALPLSGVHKDVVIVEAGTTVEADLIATNPGNTLFHCHQQDHMDSGFMALFRYA